MCVNNHPLSLIHVGFQKCGSMTLQKGFFEEYVWFEYFGKGAGDDITEKIIFQIHELYQYDYKIREDEIEESIDKCFSGKHTRVISDENFTASSYRLYAQRLKADRSLVATRMYELFLGGRVLMVIRNQFDVLPL